MNNTFFPRWIKPFTGIFFFLFISAVAVAQDTYIPLGNYSYSVLERLQIKSGRFAPSFDSNIKPIGRRRAVQFIGHVDSLYGASHGESHLHPYWQGLNLSESDKYNMQKILADNAEWTLNGDGYIPSDHPLWKTFYKDKANLYKVDEPDFFLSVNPLLRLQAGTSKDGHEMNYIATRGAEIRGRIADKIGFYTMVTENQERPPLFMSRRINKDHAIPGIGYYKGLKSGGYDYLDASGYFTFDITKYIDVQFGYGNNFIGAGYRSLFLSNNAANYLFLKLNTRIWKLNYTNIFAELISAYPKRNGDRLLPKKYIALHHLDINITPWLNIGAFESVILSREHGFDLEYLNPIIFYRTAEQRLGSPDNANIGLDAKAIIARHFELYGQFFLDELKVKQFFGSDGWWGNKWGLQLGGKYVDAFNISNLDLQGELNVIRPYTYSHKDSVSNYSHYNQPLAHPKGANLVEAVALVHYQPIPKLSLSLRITSSLQGRDSASSDWGGNILIPYTNRENIYGNTIGQGLEDKVLNASLTASYEVKHNFFIDLSYLLRKDRGAWAVENQIEDQDCNMLSVGLRWNMGRKSYDF